jgi:hypothetical protein
VERLESRDVPSWGTTLAVPGWVGVQTQGSDLALADLNRNGRVEAVLAWVDNTAGDNTIYYKVGRDLNSQGQPANGWTDALAVPEAGVGWETAGLGATLADVNRDGKRDLILAWVDNPTGDNHIFYRIGFGLRPSGSVSRWTSILAVPGGIGFETQGLAVATADLNRDGTRDLMLAFVDNPTGDNHVFYRIGFGLRASGEVRNWAGILPVPGGIGFESGGFGLTLADLDRDRRVEMLFSWADDPTGGNQIYYKVGNDLNAQGSPLRGWSSTMTSTDLASIGDQTQGLGAAVADINRDGKRDLVFAWVDDPGGENRILYKIGSGLRSDGSIA